MNRSRWSKALLPIDLVFFVSFFQEPSVFCDELTGINIVLGSSNTSHQLHLSSDKLGEANVTTRAPNSSLLVLTRMDARSMFERSGFGTQSILPGLSVLLSAAVHLLRQPAFKVSSFRKFFCWFNPLVSPLMRNMDKTKSWHTSWFLLPLDLSFHDTAEGVNPEKDGPRLFGGIMSTVKSAWM